MRTIGYLSMEIGLDASIPTYAGGLGILAGDTVRAAADLGLTFVAATLLYRDGYFTQRIDAQGQQTEVPTAWNPERQLEPVDALVSVPIFGRRVYVRAWRRLVRGVFGSESFVYFLDTNLDLNHPDDRNITDALYASATDKRLAQEIVLGIGARRMLRAIGHQIDLFHLNEGHAALLAVELLSEQLAIRNTGVIDDAMVLEVRKHCIFTTHTPIPGGHDQFPLEQVRAAVGNHPIFDRPDLCTQGGMFHTTRFLINLAGKVNGVARRHGEVTRNMFPGASITHITNGVHTATWVTPTMAALYDSVAQGWRADSAELMQVLAVRDDDMLSARYEAKEALAGMVQKHVGASLDPRLLTLGFARRQTEYKRPAMLLSDPAKLAAIAASAGGLQIVYSGKAHPGDGIGRGIIREIHAAAERLRDRVRVVFLPDYDMEQARTIVSGVDVWVNTPRPPLEASGTSGMKAAANGVPSLSTPDGWWLEGCVDGVTGWFVGAEGQSDEQDAADLFATLATRVLPAYRDRATWASICKHAVALNGPRFSAHRMIQDYASRLYFG
ncbi:MAG: alpha-glucan family phosphorylase [Phycisphaerales bacterium]